MIQKLASLTPEQISALPPADRAALMELVRPFASSAQPPALTGYAFAETTTWPFIKLCMVLHASPTLLHHVARGYNLYVLVRIVKNQTANFCEGSKLQLALANSLANLTAKQS